MKILIANLKHFYQCRRLWLYYLFLLPYLASMVYLPRRAHTGSLHFIVFSFYAGYMVADLQRNILTKPFSFCMPGHRTALRSVTLTVGLALNFIFAIRSYWYYEIGLPHVLIMIMAAGLAGIMFYLLGVWTVLLTKGPTGLMFIFPLIPLTFFFAPRNFLENIAIPLSVIAVGILSCVISWGRLGRDAHARKFCGQLVVGMMGAGSPSTAQKIRRREAVKGSSGNRSILSDNLESSFLAKIKACPSLNKGKYALGALYVYFGRQSRVGWMIMPFIMIAGILYFGYFPESPQRIFFYIFPVFPALSVDLISHRALLLPGGRSEKYYAALVTGAAITVLWTLSVAIYTAASIPLATILPNFALGSHAFVFRALDLRYSYLCLFVMPIGLLLGTMFSKNNLLMKTCIAVGLVLISGVIAGVIYREQVAALILPDSLFRIVCLVAISWAGSAALLCYHCRRQNLVGQGS